jgi:HEAT repeat protein
MSLDKFFEVIKDPSANPHATDLIEVSNLSPAELGRFARVWFTIPVERQRSIVTMMVEVAEDNPELDFCAVFKMCLKDRDEVVLEKAIEGLWEYEDRSIIPALVQILRSPRGPIARATAAMALGKFSALAQEGKILAKDGNLIRDSLMAVLADPDEHLEVRRRSLEAVAPFNTPDIVQYLCWAYKSNDLKLKSSSIYAMGRTGETSWLPLLVKELQNQQPTIRYETATACGELGDEDVVPHLLPLLQDDDYQVQLAGISALGKIGGPLAKRALLRCVKEGDAALEEPARSALENIEFLEDPMTFSSNI